MPKQVIITVVPKACPFCKRESSSVIRVGQDDYNAWLGGKLIQDAMPYLTADERESLMTGMCDSCWESM